MNAIAAEFENAISHDSELAVALANALALLAVFPSLVEAKAASDGGYRGFFSSFLVFRVAATRLGFVEAWRGLLARDNMPDDGKNLALSTFEDRAICRFITLVPRFEKNAIAAMFRGMASFDPGAPSQYNNAEAVLRNPDEAIQGLLLPQVGEWLGRQERRGAERPRPPGYTGLASISAHQAALNAGFTDFR